MRLLKKFLYGFAYVVFFAAIGVGVYYLRSFDPAPSCFDNVLNQSETKVDCGPALPGETSLNGCVPCELKNLKAGVGTPNVFSLSGSISSVVAEISNPSRNYGASSIKYVFELTGRSGIRLRATGETVLYPAERKYLFVSGIDIDQRDVETATLTLGDAQWILKDALPHRLGLVVADVKLIDMKGVLTIEGAINNDSPARAALVTVIGLGFDASGKLIKASSTEVEDIGPFSKTPFKIFMPAENYARVQAQIAR